MRRGCTGADAPGQMHRGSINGSDMPSALGLVLKRGLFKGIKNDTPMCQMRKYINTNTQIHKYSI